MLAIGNKKQCSSCKNILDLEHYNKHSRTKDNLQNCCKSCKAKMTKNWKYSLLTGRYNQMVKDQLSCCKICGNFDSKLVIDHNHVTGKLRALLCRKCNALLGMCNDNIEVLKNSISYLRIWTEE